MIFTFFSCIFLISLVYYAWKRRNLYITSRQFKGGFAFPLIGNCYIFTGNDEDSLEKLRNYIKTHRNKYNDPLKFWIGTQLAVVFLNPKHVEKILSSQLFAQKHEIYDFIKRVLGDGLVSASGPVYKRNKKTILPLLKTDFVNSCIEIYQQCCRDSIKEIIENYSSTPKTTFNIQPVFQRCFARINTRCFLGVDIDPVRNAKFLEYSEELYYVIFARFVRPWIYPDFCYNFTELATKEAYMLDEIHGFMRNAIENSKKTENSAKFTPFLDKFLEKIGNEMSEREILDQITTLYIASEDTLTLVSSFCCMCLGMYPEYQMEVAEELRSYFGEKPRVATLEDVAALPYLDRVIKETMRLVPIASSVLRKVPKNTEIDGWKLVEGSSVVIPVDFIHRDPEHWENPEHFHPDHFLPEAEAKRANYAYLPFSSGPRGCIGKTFANLALRVFLATFLQYFEVEADGKLPDVKMKMDISTRPVKGCNVRIKRRIWT